MKAICIDATPIPHFSGTILDYTFPCGMLEEGEAYEVASVVDRGERGFIIAGKPVIGSSGEDLGWSPRRFKFVVSNSLNIELHESETI